jgi:electron transport complex protein RnfC
MIERKQRSLTEAKALSQEEAVEIMRQVGIIGAGGAGFPTYIKYKNPQPHLLINATESEPGYQADKVVHKEHLDEFLLIYEALKSIFGFEQVSMCVHEKDREWFADYQEHSGEDSLYDMRYVPDRYSLGRRRSSSSTPPTPRCPGGWTCPTGTAARGCRRTPASSSTTRRPC